MSDTQTFVVRQDGFINVFPNDSSVTSAGVFLNISGKISSAGNEEGLLGLAFPPDFPSTRRFYINYTAPSSNSPSGIKTVVARYSVSVSDSNRADSTSEVRLLEIEQPFRNHNGGMMAFGPDSSLLASAGIADLFDAALIQALGLIPTEYLFFYYSQGLLYRTINMNLLPVRSSVFIIASFLIWYSQAFRGSDARVSISRHVFYRSVALLVVGCYLLGLGLIGEGMRYFGEAFGRNVAIVVAFLGGIFLLAVLFSDKARRRAKVYISKHFYANKHDYREEWLRLNNRLSSCATLPDVQEAVLTAYQETFGVSGASLYLLGSDEKRYIRASGHFMPDVPVELHLTEGLRDYFVKQGRVLNLLDREYQLTESERAPLTEARAWLVVPLISNARIEGLAVLREQIVPPPPATRSKNSRTLARIRSGVPSVATLNWSIPPMSARRPPIFLANSHGSWLPPMMYGSSWPSSPIAPLRFRRFSAWARWSC